MASPERRAVIDIGTNSIKLLVADVAGPSVHPVWEGSRQTRLGQGFYETHRLRPEAVARTAEKVAELAQIAREHQAAAIRVIATSAARDAQNPEILSAAVAGAARLDVEIISGEQEAEWAFRGVTSDPGLKSRPLLLLDLGGGSTEFILGCGDHKHFQRSFPLGTVRLMEKVPHSDPPRPAELEACREWVRQFLETEVAPGLRPAIAREQDLGRGLAPVLVGTGGTATILARMHHQLEAFDRERLESTCLRRDQVLAQVRRLWSLPLAERRQIPGLPANRADVILTGALIFGAILEQFDFSDLRISTRGLRFGAILA